MKKNVLFIVFATLIGGSVSWAQDTIVANSPKETYFYHPWIDRDTVMLLESDFHSDPGCFNEEAYAWYTKDTIQVYGLTVSLSLKDFWSYGQEIPCSDTTMDSIYSMVRLYERTGNTLRVLGERCAHLRDSAIAYYLLLNKWNELYDIPMVPIPVYELYFDTPITIVDSFFVGFTFSKCAYLPGGGYTHRYSYSINGYQDRMERRTTDEPFVRAYHRGGDSTWRFTSSIYAEHYHLYAIIAPPDSTVNPGDTIINPGDTIINPGDTIINPGDTLAIRTNDILYRYTALQPNPASDKVKVLSSFGITAIEAYDLRGRKVYEVRTPNSEFKVTLDVSSWPRGTYLLRITTSNGITTKKLLLR